MGCNMQILQNIILYYIYIYIYTVYINILLCMVIILIYLYHVFNKYSLFYLFLHKLIDLYIYMYIFNL